MRKHQQRQILELLATVKEAQSAGLYADCQECAISIGEFIEGIEGDGTQTVKLLEEYCDLLYEASIGETGKNQLNKKLVKIENSVRSELKPDRIEMVFLTYKASMGDSLETIYQAAKADPACDAYWIPIPYFDRNSDGSAGAMHYEGAECYGGNIECIDYREYDIEARRPDVIFTFNPYDAGNYVTSVHPAYYCKRLRGLCDLLVYIPYFVNTNDVQEYHCTTAGCMYAHRVIVQSEKVRETYIRVFKETYGDMYGKPEDKFVALGSPKFDKVINSKREDFELPDEWAELIGNKKVVLYNTSIAGILDNTERYLKKLRQVLDIFRNRDDVVLWWRPHPLIESVFKSMRRPLFNEYEQIAAGYRREGWGIYDDSPDFHRAIAWSDAYYGDPSSARALYLLTGKPILMQTSSVDSQSDEIVLKFENLYDDGQYFWFTEYRFNALFRMEKDTWSVEFMGVFPNEKLSCNRLYSSIAKCGGKLYFAPFSANEIAEYAPETGEFRKISFTTPVKKHHYYDYVKLYKAVCLDKRVFFIPYYYPGIICYDTETQHLSYYDEWVSKVEKLRTVEELGYFEDFVTDGIRLILPCACADAIVVFCTDTMTSEVWPSPGGSCKDKYIGVCYDGDNYYFVFADGIAIKRKMQSQSETVTKLELPNVCHDAKTNRYAFAPVRYFEGYVWLFPHKKNAALKMDVATGEISAAEAFDDESKYEGNSQCFLQVEIINGRIYAMTGRSSRFIEYDPKTNIKREMKLTLSSGDHAKINRLFSEELYRQASHGYINEDEFFTLKNMLDGLKNTDAPNRELTNKNPITAGKTILDFVKEKVMP